MENRKTKSVQQNMIYNTVGSLVYYFCQWVMTVLIVRMSGFEDAGILSLAMSVTAAPAIVGLFNIRSYQVSDLKGQYSDSVYIRSRVYTNLLSFVVCLFVVFVNGYPLEKAAVILMFMCFKMAEGAADVYYGIDQKKERLDYAGISLTIRGLGSLALFCGIFMLTKNLFFCVLGMSFFSFAVVFVYDRRIVSRLTEEREPAAFSQIKSLLITCLPLAVVAFLNNLSLTIPKIYLEKYYGEEIFGIYSSVSSPTIVVQLAATTLFAPLVPVLTKQFNENHKKEFRKILAQFFGLILAGTVLGVVLSKLLADWVLKILYGEEIGPYTNLFIPVFFIAVLIAVNASLFSVCTLIREIKSQYVVGIAGIVSAFLLSVTVVKELSLEGTILAFVGTLVIQIVIQIFLIVRKVRKIDGNCK